MSKRYGVQTGIPDFPLTQDQEQYNLVLPLYRGLVSVAQQVSDATGLTAIPMSDAQNHKPQSEYLLDRLGRMSFVAGEAITAGHLISLDSTAGESKVWKANCLSGSIRQAHGVCIESEGAAAGQRVRVLLFRALVIGLSEVTPGTVYWLGSAGQFSSAMPASPNLQQKVGIGLNTTTIAVNIAL